MARSEQDAGLFGRTAAAGLGPRCPRLRAGARRGRRAGHGRRGSGRWRERRTVRPDAGHILGSAGILLEIDDGPTIYFTGDIGRPLYPILRDPEPLPEVDVVLSECTYGTRDHEPRGEAQATIARILERAIRTKGKIFVPAFSVGRTQNLIYGYARLREAGEVPDIPIYVDSPLAKAATEVFSEHPECYDAELREFEAAGGEAFYPEGVTYTSSTDESKALNDKEGPFIVLAGSGMCEGGRIVHHLLHGLEDQRNTVLMVGWSAPGTLGRRIMDREERVRIFGKWLDVNAQVERIGAFSAHAGRSELLDFLAPAREMGAAIMLVHGDADTALAFADTLRDAGHEDVTVPETYAEYTLKRRKHVPY